jgi:hypothetical protein
VLIGFEPQSLSVHFNPDIKTCILSLFAGSAQRTQDLRPSRFGA